MNEVLTKLEQSADRLRKYNAAMSSFTLYGESCALCGSYLTAFADDTVRQDPDFLKVRQSVIDLFGEDRVLSLEAVDETKSMTMIANVQAMSYADEVVRSRTEVESSEQYELLSQVMSDASFVSAQATMLGYDGVDRDVVKQQMETLFGTYAAVSQNMIEGLESVKELVREEMVQQFGANLVETLESEYDSLSDVVDQYLADNMDTEMETKEADRSAAVSEEERESEPDVETESDTEVEAESQLGQDSESNYEDEEQSNETVPRSAMAEFDNNYGAAASYDVEPEF